MGASAGANALLRYIHTHNLTINQRFQREMLRMTLQTLMEWDVSALINASHYERIDSRKTYRNGYRERTWRSSVGEISLFIPKLRNGTYSPDFIRYAERLTLKLAPEAYLGILNPQDITALSHTLGLPPLPSSETYELVTNLSLLADRLHHTPITSQYHTLWLDEIDANSYKTIYVAVGVGENEQAELIALEDQPEKDWSAFLEKLKWRGLRDVPVVSSEADMKILNAIGTTLPQAEWQMGEFGALPRAEHTFVSTLYSTFSLDDDLMVSPFVYESDLLVAEWLFA